MHIICETVKRMLECKKALYNLIVGSIILSLCGGCLWGLLYLIWVKPTVDIQDQIVRWLTAAMVVLFFTVIIKQLTYLLLDLGTAMDEHSAKSVEDQIRDDTSRLRTFQAVFVVTDKTIAMFMGIRRKYDPENTLTAHEAFRESFQWVLDRELITLKYVMAGIDPKQALIDVSVRVSAETFAKLYYGTPLQQAAEGVSKDPRAWGKPLLYHLPSGNSIGYVALYCRDLDDLAVGPTGVKMVREEPYLDTEYTKRMAKITERLYTPVPAVTEQK